MLNKETNQQAKRKYKNLEDECLGTIHKIKVICTVTMNLYTF